MTRNQNEWLNARLAPNFRLGEFVNPDWVKNPLRGLILTNLTNLAQLLQPVRDRVGPIIITSGYRTPEQNEAAGGASASLHLTGRACDCYAQNLTISEFHVMAKNLWLGGVGWASRVQWKQNMAS